MKNKYGIGDVFLLPFEVIEVRTIDGKNGVRYKLKGLDCETHLWETTLDRYDMKTDIEDRDETEQSNGNDPCDGSKRN